jgi:hypothetical protein
VPRQDPQGRRGRRTIREGDLWGARRASAPGSSSAIGCATEGHKAQIWIYFAISDRGRVRLARNPCMRRRHPLLGPSARGAHLKKEWHAHT